MIAPERAEDNAEEALLGSSSTAMLRVNAGGIWLVDARFYTPIYTVVSGFGKP